VNPGHQPSWERLLWWLIAAVVVLELLSSLLPRLLVPLVVVTVSVGVLRLIWHFTNHH